MYIYFHLLWKNNKLIYLKLKLKFNLFSTWWVDNHEMWHSTHISQQTLEINKYILSTYPIGFWKEPVIHLKRRISKVAVSLKNSRVFLQKTNKKNLLFVFRQFLRYRLCLLLDQCHSSTNSSNNNACVSLHIKVLFIPIENKMYISVNQQFQMSNAKTKYRISLISIPPWIVSPFLKKKLSI